ncbi:alkyl sulfatase dimerization domain-containing protein [uncultured Gimesia sp.]|uniref:alkyl/aryl-sulfatase n=1 Tax=uncultured Gimesia sp. TaxID=1678688 RepID=UPI0026192917|nr:alkyl sulfatase dimerization domain-containing protein [uncultured Gimesia sp.]
MMTRIFNTAIAVAACFMSFASISLAKEIKHFDKKGKPPSEHTIALHKEIQKSLPFNDRRDFEEFKRGFIAAPDYTQIKADAGHVAWDMGRYDFLNKKDATFYSIHPSLLRQSRLNMNFGLYEVLKDKIYQVRGFDLANITFVKGKTGWIIFDTGMSPETARAAYKLVTKHLGKREIVAVVHSHTHADHWGGVRGLIKEEDVRSGKIPIIVPGNFQKHVVSENVYAGNAMNRRMYYQYGTLLDASPYGHVDQAIGKNISRGNIGLIVPSREIFKDLEEITIDGLKMVFQLTPDTEAPAEMNTYFPEWKALWIAENIVNSIHNIYTLRGAALRDALNWSREINRTLYLFGQEAEVMFGSHNWPRWGNERIQEIMRVQRDIYANMNNQVLNLANQGSTINTIHNEFKVPKSLQNHWAARGYHGSVEHNVRGVVNKYLGYWDCNPTTLIPLSPSESAPLYVEMMGGADPIIKKGKELYTAGKYKLAMEILNKLVQAEPENQEAKDLLADIFEQLGYQQESPSVRNSFLAGAFELRNGIRQGNNVKTAGPDAIRAMSTVLFLEYLGIRVDSSKAEGMQFTINLITPDNGEKLVIEMSNATLTVLKGFQAPKADLTITINRADLIDVMIQKTTLAQQIIQGKARLEGDPLILAKLQSTLIEFELNFEILPGTKVTKE